MTKPMNIIPAITPNNRRSWLRPAVATTAAVEAATFYFFGLAHTGLRIPLGLATVSEPRIVPATVVEWLCGLALAGGACAIAVRHPRGWAAALGAQLFALAGVGLGLWAGSSGEGATALNHTYHLVMLGCLAAGGALLLTPAGKATLSRKPSAPDTP
ncbi:MAG TPA: hypothetical protein VFA70_06455 [Dehalococcoidia bacterium]|jgi:hypothetical protein|nr:hypothetical protein [Dehalococcoidia bacterium]